MVMSNMFPTAVVAAAAVHVHAAFCVTPTPPFVPLRYGSLFGTLRVPMIWSQ